MPEPVYSGSNRIVVDWDGTCVPEEWPEQPPMWYEAAQALHAFLDAGLEVVILSTRLAPKQVDEKTDVPADEWVREYGYIRRELNNSGLMKVRIWLEPWKPGARAYVDDKGIRFDGDWNSVVAQIVGMRTRQREETA